MILSLFRKDPAAEAAAALYAAAVDQARAPEFYAHHGVEDTPVGRFEMLCLHVFLLLRRLRGAGAEADRAAQKLLDAFFANLDASLREMGVGDLSVAKKIRALAEGFYGRIGAYESALAEEENGPLEAALSRNVYASEAHPGAPALARYLRQAAGEIEAQPISRLAAGIVRFPAAPAPEEAANG